MAKKIVLVEIEMDADSISEVVIESMACLIKNQPINDVDREMISKIKSVTKIHETVIK